MKNNGGKYFKNAESAGFSTQSGALGLSLFISQGSLSPTSYPPVHAPSCSEKKNYLWNINESIV